MQQSKAGRLLDLINSDIYTDAEEYESRVDELQQLANLILRPLAAINHTLQVRSLHPAQASCSCQCWNLYEDGARTREHIEQEHRLHAQQSETRTETSTAWDTAKCTTCSAETYRKHFLFRDGKPYCEDCAPKIGLTEENQDGADLSADEEAKLLHAILDHIAQEAEILLPAIEGGGAAPLCISVNPGEFSIWFGTANTEWCGQYLTNEGEQITIGGEQGIDTDVPSTCRDPKRIAQAIMQAAKKATEAHEAEDAKPITQGPNATHCDECGKRLDQSKGKALGCDECDAVFCSADCQQDHINGSDDDPPSGTQAMQDERKREEAQKAAILPSAAVLQTFHVMKEVTSVYHVEVQATTPEQARQLADANEHDDGELVEDFSDGSTTWKVYTDAEYNALERDEEEQEQA
jgi:hypothetical protein